MTAREDAIEAVLKRDGGTCHGFGRLHCFIDPAAKWEGRRCTACHDWAAAVVGAAEPIIRADERAKAHVHNMGTSSPDACCECCYDVHSLERDHLAARRRVKELVDERQHLRTSVANMWGRSSEWDDAIEAVLRQMDASLGGESE